MLTDALVGAVLEGRYRVEALIARGGMSTVYAGLDLRLERRVAIKVMAPALAGDPVFTERFTREARAAARLASANVVAVHDQGTDAGVVFLVMEHVVGRTLRDLLQARGRLTPDQAVVVLDAVLSGLGAAHAAGLVHRDVKPENVLLGDDGSIKVVDFGLARAVEASRLTATAGVLLGTVAYLAPEQVLSGTSDERTDVYAAGLLLFEMLTGAPPYAGETAISVAYRHVHDDVPPPSSVVPDVPRALDELTVRATRREPGARPADARAFRADLRRAAADLELGRTPLPRTPAARRPVPVQPTALLGSSGSVLAAPARHPTSPGLAPPRRRRVGRAVALPLIALGLLLALGAGWLTVWRYDSAPPLLSLPQAEAVERARAAGFGVRFGNEVYSETVPAGRVAEVTPGPGDRVPRGATLTLALSKGQERYPVPQLRGRPRAEAEAELRAARLEVGAVVSAYDDEVPRGSVVSSTPSSGERLRRGSAVNLALSQGPPPVAVPTVAGAPLTQGRERLTDAGLTATVTEVFSETAERGEVIAQSPESGSLPKGSAVELTVSKGPELIRLPDVDGERREQAVRRLEQLGLRVRVFDVPGGSGRVISQAPQAGELVRKRSSVTLYLF